MRWWEELARVVVPVACAGCGAPDEPWCAACRAALGAPVRCESGAPRLDRLDGRPVLPVWACAPYVGAVRAAVVAWKDRGRADLDPGMRAVLASASRRLAPSLAGVLAGRELLVVPVPSSAAAVRRRGADLVGGLAGAVAAELRRSGVPARSLPALRRRGGADQVGLGARARRRNLAGRLRARQGLALAGRPVLLVDDVLTTGASLAACEEVLGRSGACVLAALVLAATPPPGRDDRLVPVRDRRAGGAPRAGIR